MKKPGLHSLSRLLSVVCIVLLTTMLILGCKKYDEPTNHLSADDPLKPTPEVTSTVAGLVVDESGKPLGGVTIEVHGESTTTTSDGIFLLEDIRVPGNRCVVSGHKEGYFTGTRALVPNQDQHTATRIVLMSSATTHRIDANSGGKATLANGSEVEIAANGLVTESGSAYTGQVNMTVRHLDPTFRNFSEVSPGGDMLARRTDESSSILYSYGVLRVQLTGSNGENLQLAAGKPSTITMTIPEEQLATAPATIPLWYFDEEAGIWQEEGSATKQGNKYVGTVKHFTDWNADDPKKFATIIGRLVDCHGRPSEGLIEFGQITSDPQTSTDTDPDNGRFVQRVPAGIPLTVIINDPLLIGSLTPMEKGKVIVLVPPLEPGQVYDVGDIKTFPCDIDLEAQLKTELGDAVNHVSFTSQGGTKSVFNVGEKLSAKLPPNMDLTMTIRTKSGITHHKQIKTPAENEKLDLGIIDLKVPQKAFITGKTVCYGNAETSGQISIKWKDENGNQLDYTSPGPDGTFRIEAPLSQSIEVSSTTKSGSWKKTIQTSATAGSMIDLGTTEICANTNVGETSFVITGDGFNNTVQTVNTNKSSQAYSYALYAGGTSNSTMVEIQDLSGNLTVGVNFEGKAVGQPDNTTTSSRITRKVGGKTIYYEAGSFYPGTSLSINITKYDNVGGVVEGTFSGTFRVVEGNTTTGQTVTITNGKFSTLRYKDIY